MWPEIASIGFHTHCTGLALNLQELNNLVFSLARYPIILFSENPFGQKKCSLCQKHILSGQKPFLPRKSVQLERL